MDTVAGTTQLEQRSQENGLYDRDHYMWTMQQADALRRGDFDAVDWENVTREIEALVTGHESALQSQYIRIMEHFLKLQYWNARDPDPVTRWEISLDNARIEIKTLFRKHPSLKGSAEALFQDAWPIATLKASTALANSTTTRITDSSIRWRERKRLRREWAQVLPSRNPYTLSQAHNLDWWPQRIPVPQRPAIQHPPQSRRDWTR